jgi:hypothetical protein
MAKIAFLTTSRTVQAISSHFDSLFFRIRQLAT